MVWPNDVQPFGHNHIPVLNGLASDGSGKTVPVAVDKNTGALLSEVVVTPAELPTAFVNGQATVGTTAAALPSNALNEGVIVQALSTNTASIFIGVVGVTTGTGFELQPGQATSIAVSNTNVIYAISSVAAQAVCFIGS